MITVRDYIIYHIDKCNNEIYKIKNYNTFSNSHCTEDNKYHRGFINPGDKLWGKYKGLKRELSKWLTLFKFVETSKLSEYLSDYYKAVCSHDKNAYQNRRTYWKMLDDIFTVIHLGTKK
jgi:hypothetical protein